MSKAKINAREVVQDIKSGMTDPELMQKYSLTPKGLESLFSKLVQAKILEQSFVEVRGASSGSQAPAGPTRPSVPAARKTKQAPEGLSESDLAILQDIKDGKHDNEIMRSHELSPGGLKQIKAGFEQKGLLQAAPKALEDEDDPYAGIETGLCPFCSKEVQISASECEHCGRRLESSPPSGTFATGASAQSRHAPDEGAYEEEKECPWEDRASYGTLNAFFQTATKCITTPTSFFSRLPTTGGYFNPLLFAAMTFPIATLLTLVWYMLFKGAGLGGMIGGVLGMSCAFVGGFILAAVGVTIWSGILHLCLAVLGGAREGYQATFRVVSYSSVTSLFSVIPFVGSLAASVWGIVLTVIGLRETHKTTTGKAAVAVTIPVALAVLLGIIIGVAGVAKLKSFGQASIPPAACPAMETFIAGVDNAQGADSQAVSAEVNAAFRALNLDLQSLPDQTKLVKLRQKAVMFGLAVIQQKASGTPSPKVNELRNELRNMCK
jgi:hypothetical protein